MAKSEKIIISVQLTDKGLKASSTKAKAAIDGITQSTSKLDKATEALKFQQTDEAKKLAELKIKTQLATEANRQLALSTLAAADASKQGRTQSGLNNAILTETGRMASDAAYGMQGMANNLGQLMTLMNQHAQTRGGFLASFKELGRSLLGGGGILIGLQLLISFAPQIQKFFQTWGDEANKAKEEQEALNKSLSEYREGLRGVEKAKLEGLRDSAKEISKLKILKSRIDDTNLSQKKRLEYVNILKADYPEYLENISDEDALVGGLDEKYDELTTSILKNAKAQAAAKIISENYQKQITLQFQLQENAIELVENQAKVEAVASQAREAISKQAEGGHYGMVAQIQVSSKLTNAVNDGLEKQVTIAAEINKLNEENIALAEDVEFFGGKKKKGAGEGSKRVSFFKQMLLNLEKELLKYQKAYKKTTLRNEQEIIRDSGDASVKLIELKRDEFNDKQELRLKEFIEKQELRKEEKGADKTAINASIERAKNKTAESIKLANKEAKGVIAAINEVTEARITNQIRIEELNALKRGSKEEESSASNTVDMMPEGMEKIEAEKALSDLRYNNKVAAAEAELEMLAENSDKKKDLLSQMSIWEDERRVVDLQNEIDVVNEKQRVNEEYMGFLSGISGVLSTLAGESELIRKTALVLEKGAAIASVIGQTNAANANIASQSSDAAVNVASKGWAATDVGAMMMASGNIVQGKAMMAAGTKGIATGAKITAGAKAAMGRNRIGAGIAIAGILAESVVGLDSGGRGGSSSGGGGGQTVQPPDFNIIGSTGTNQLAEAIGTTTKLPIKAYVVSSDVTSAQEMDRNIVESSSIG